MKASRLFYLFSLSIMALLSLAPAALSDNPLADDVFIRNWSITEPVAVAAATDMESQEKAFSTEPLELTDLGASLAAGQVVIGEKSYAWKNLSSDSGIFDLVKELGAVEYCYVYAIAEVMSATDQQVLLGIGSDDGI
ncbi:hypothetical protein JXA02_12575, partial [candidate division KSB1 bacterium]|nr:hypothetical protein [candidate division KSB1 bacterium]